MDSTALLGLYMQTKTWPIAVTIEPLGVDPAFSYDPARRQYNSTRILERLPRGRIAVTDVDLFIPILEFVFGEAELGGGRGIISTCRLREEFYGLPANPALLRERMVKEARHEWGHALGLLHCFRFDCVMRASPSVVQIDLKSGDFCPNCRKTLRVEVGDR